MRRTMRYLWIVMSLLIVGSTLTVPVFAHEGRVFAGGSYVIFVGFRNEPAFEDEGNALDFFVLYDTNGNGECDDDTCSDWLPVDKGLGDGVNLRAEVLYLEEDAFNARVLDSARLRGAVEQDFEDPSRYNIFFKPNVDGAYGFRIEATIRYRGSDSRFPDPGPLLTIEGRRGKFVCEGGSQDPDSEFNCVANILQPFPLGAGANYRNDSPISRVTGVGKRSQKFERMMQKRGKK